MGNRPTSSRVFGLSWNLGGVFAFLFLPCLVSAAEPSKAEKADQLYRVALVAAEAGDFAVAEAKLSQAVELAPDNAILFYNLAFVQEKLGKVTNAKESLEKALRLGLKGNDKDAAKSLAARLEYAVEKSRSRSPLPSTNDSPSSKNVKGTVSSEQAPSTKRQEDSLPGYDDVVRLSEPHKGWVNSPEASFLTPVERKEWPKLQSDSDRKAFIERYWARRNPNSANAQNVFRYQVARRTRAADEQFGSRRYPKGSESPRGRAFVVLGAPNRATQTRSSNDVVMMVWTYERDHFEPSWEIGQLVVRFAMDVVKGTEEIVEPSEFERAVITLAEKSVVGEAPR